MAASPAIMTKGMLAEPARHGQRATPHRAIESALETDAPSVRSGTALRHVGPGRKRQFVDASLAPPNTREQRQIAVCEELEE